MGSSRIISVGIDPGLKGGIVALDMETRKVLDEDLMPTYKDGKKDQYDAQAMCSVIQRYRGVGVPFFTIERVQAMPGMGTVSRTSLGMGYGIWIGIFASLGVKYQTVLASQWSREILKGIPGKGKDRSLTFVRQMYPDLDLIPEGKKKPQDGLTDACCIAHWGCLKWQSNTQ